MNVNFDLLLVVIVSVTSLLMAVFVLKQARGKIYTGSFIAMCLMFIAWTIANYVTNHYLQDIALAQLASKGAYVFGYGIFVSGLLFTLNFPTRQSIHPRNRWILVGVVLLTVILSGTNLVAGELMLIDDSLQFSNGSLLWLYLLSSFFIIGWAMVNLGAVIRHESDSLKKQAMILLAGFVSSALLGVIFSVILPLFGYGWQMTRLAPITPLILIVTIVYATVRHGLFDIRTTVIRSIAYMLSIATLAFVYFGFAYLASALFFKNTSSSELSVSPFNVILALVLAFIFQPIKSFFDHVTDKIFFRDQYDMDGFIAKIGEVSTSTTSLRTLLRRASQAIKMTLKSSFVTFVVHREKGRDIVLGSGDNPRLVAGEYSVIHEALATNLKDTVVIEQDSRSALETIAKRHDIALIVPLGEVGYLLLGGQKSTGYKTRDLRALRAIKNELLIAIQNVRSVQEIRDLNMHLQQRIDEATKELRASNSRLRKLDETKDEFMSIASHQLRTPLTSIKGYLSIILDGDLGRVPASQKKVLKEALGSSERMVSLISDFLNVSRLQTGKFVIDHVETDIEKLVATEVKNLQQSAASRDLKLHLHRSRKKIPLLYIDEVKLRQVVMNFIDNSLYYSHPGEEVNVHVERKSGYVEVRVVDTGIGVPKGERERLFTKFFRATNAHKRRPDGTGVGLFLAKKVIDGHGGEIIFNSKENKGSTFGFRIPISSLSKQPKV